MRKWSKFQNKTIELCLQCCTNCCTQTFAHWYEVYWKLYVEYKAQCNSLVIFKNINNSKNATNGIKWFMELNLILKKSNCYYSMCCNLQLVSKNECYWSIHLCCSGIYHHYHAKKRLRQCLSRHIIRVCLKHLFKTQEVTC